MEQTREDGNDCAIADMLISRNLENEVPNGAQILRLANKFRKPQRENFSREQAELNYLPLLLLLLPLVELLLTTFMSEE